MTFPLSIAVCLSLILASCTIVPIDHSKLPESDSLSASGTEHSDLEQASQNNSENVVDAPSSESLTGKREHSIEAAWERQMATISSQGTESYVLSKGGVVQNISNIMSKCSNTLEIHGRNGMGKAGCAEFIEYQVRYNDFSALFILTALYQRDFVENQVRSNTVYSYPAESVLKQAYAAHQNYEAIAGRP